MKNTFSFTTIGISILLCIANLSGTSAQTIDETVAIQTSIDSCGKLGGGTVRIKKGIHSIRPIFLKSNVILHLDAGATLLATDKAEDFMVDGKYISLINGKKLTNVTINGEGVIDGNGKDWWKRFLDSDRRIPRPKMIVLNNITNLTIEGVTLQNSPSFLLMPTDCENVTINNVTALAPENAPNTDGIDPSRCKNVKITNCKIDVDDDNIAVKAGGKENSDGYVCENLEVTNCTFYRGHGLSIGSETNGGIRNMRVDSCKFVGTDNGIRIKSSNTRGGLIENISYSNITMTDVKNPIVIDMTYVDKNAINRGGPEAKPTLIPKVNGISIKNVTATGAKKAGVIKGLDESILRNILLENVSIAAKTGMVIENAHGLNFTSVKITVEKGDVYTKKNAEGKGIE